MPRIESSLTHVPHDATPVLGTPPPLPFVRLGVLGGAILAALRAEFSWRRFWRPALLVAACWLGVDTAPKGPDAAVAMVIVAATAVCGWLAVVITRLARAWAAEYDALANPSRELATAVVELQAPAYEDAAEASAAQSRPPKRLAGTIQQSGAYLAIARWLTTGVPRAWEAAPALTAYLERLRLAYDFINDVARVELALEHMAMDPGFSTAPIDEVLAQIVSASSRRFVARTHAAAHRGNDQAAEARTRARDARLQEMMIAAVGIQTEREKSLREERRREFDALTAETDLVANALSDALTRQRMLSGKLHAIKRNHGPYHHVVRWQKALSFLAAVAGELRNVIAHSPKDTSTIRQAVVRLRSATDVIREEQRAVVGYCARREEQFIPCAYPNPRLALLTFIHGLAPGHRGQADSGLTPYDSLWVVVDRSANRAWFYHPGRSAELKDKHGSLLMTTSFHAVGNGLQQQTALYIPWGMIGDNIQYPPEVSDQYKRRSQKYFKVMQRVVERSTSISKLAKEYEAIQELRRNEQTQATSATYTESREKSKTDNQWTSQRYMDAFDYIWPAGWVPRGSVREEERGTKSAEDDRRADKNEEASERLREEALQDEERVGSERSTEKKEDKDFKTRRFDVAVGPALHDPEAMYTAWQRNNPDRFGPELASSLLQLPSMMLRQVQAAHQRAAFAPKVVKPEDDGLSAVALIANGDFPWEHISVVEDGSLAPFVSELEANDD